MENQKNKYIAVVYRLYIKSEDGTEEMVEEATATQPFHFISGFGVALDAFEERIVKMEQEEHFDFTLTKDEAYGDYEDEHVLDLDRSIFTINGHFDHEHIFENAVIPLQNEDGNRFYGRVLEVGEDKVKVDLNHPLAGQDLHFKGQVLENRAATTEEVDGMLARMTNDGCGCGCHDCDGGCGEHAHPGREHHCHHCH